ncbi:MAG: hypothetical protein V4591_11540 [Bdellovibrionota bacterium]
MSNKIKGQTHQNKSNLTQAEAEEKVKKNLDMWLGVSEKSKKIIRNHLKNSWSDAPPGWRMPDLSDGELIKTLIKKNMWSPEFLPFTKKYRLVWDAMCEWGNWIFLHNKRLNGELADFYAFSHQYPEKKPTHNGTDPLLNIYRNHCLCTAIYLLQNSGYYPIMRNESTGMRDSACHIVEQVYFNLIQSSLSNTSLKNNSLGYDRIKKLWLKISEKEKKLMELKIILDSFYDAETSTEIPSVMFSCFLSNLSDSWGDDDT